jgi:CHC2 zinc finger
VSSNNDDLRWKINEAKRLLPMPRLLQNLGLGAHAKKTARCPFPSHEDKHPSFSVFMGEDGFWHYMCFSKCGDGDEILFLSKLKGLSLTEAMSLYLDMAGFPASHPSTSHEWPKSHEYPKLPESLESPVSPVFPVSNGQAPEKVLKALAARNACTQRNTAREKRWKLVRDLRAVEKGIGRELTLNELLPVFEEWHLRSRRFLDPAKTRDAYLAMFLKELRKVRVPTGEGDTLNKALEAVSKLTVSELPVIPGLPEAPESWRRLLALHCELSSRSTRKNKTYFLSYRDAAKAHQSLNHQLAYDITLAFERLSFIKIVDKGKAGPNGGKAAKFGYLLPDAGNGMSQT